MMMMMMMKKKKKNGEEIISRIEGVTTQDSEANKYDRFYRFNDAHSHFFS